MKKIPHNPDELIALVDEDDKIIGKATRKEAHLKGLLHREAYVYLINSYKQVLMHKRADINLWDHSCAGHFPKEQDYKEAAIREFEEELGIKLKINEFKEIAKEKFHRISHGQNNYRFVKIFLVEKDIPLENFRIDKNEVKEVRYFNKLQLEKLLAHPEKITSSSKEIIEKYIIEELN